VGLTLTHSLIVQTSFLGDVVLTTPLITHLARSGTVDVVTTPGAAPLLAGNRAIRRVVAYDKHGDARGFAGLARVASIVRAGTADSTAYLAQGSWRSAALALLAGYGHRVGFSTSAGRWLYSERTTYRSDQHHAERLLRLAIGAEAAIPAESLTPALFPSDTDKEAVTRLLAANGATGAPLIALAPGSVWATKRWPGFPALASALASHGRIVAVGGPGDRDLAAAIRSAVPDAIDTTGQLSLLASTELIGRSALLVTNDSLPQHLASAMGTRTVTIYGPTIPGFGFGPLAAQSATVGHEFLDCRPCHPHGPPECPLGHHRCMRDLATAEVLSRALSALAA
jgi:heptosyltransferase-2